MNKTIILTDIQVGKKSDNFDSFLPERFVSISTPTSIPILPDHLNSRTQINTTSLNSKQTIF